MVDDAGMTWMRCGRDVDDDAGGMQITMWAWTMMRACRRDVDDDAGVSP